MANLKSLYNELCSAIELHGRASFIAPEVRALADQHDMVVIERRDDGSIETDFGVRQGDAQIVVHFLFYPQTDKTPAHVAYDLDFIGAVSPSGEPDIARNSWSWDMPQAGGGDEPEFQFSVLG